MNKATHPSGNGNRNATSESHPAIIHLPSGKGIATTDHIPQKAGRSLRLPKPAPKKPIEITARDFPDGTRLRLIRDPKNPSRTLFAVWRSGRIDYLEKYVHGDETFVPLNSDDPWLRTISLPRGLLPHAKPSAMAKSAGALFNEVVKLTPHEQILLGCFVILTYRSVALPFAPTVSFRGPRDITVAILQIAGLLCRYGIVVGDVTPAGLLEACSRIHPTLLIADYGIRQDALRLLEIGSRPGVSFLCKGGALSPNCARAMACSESSVDGDLMAGGVLISLEEWSWPNLGRLTDPDFLERAEELRQQLLGYDLACSGTNQQLKGEAPCGVRPRAWDAYRCWASPFADDQDFLEEVRKAMRYAGEVSPNGLPVEVFATVSAADFLVHKNQDTASVGEIAKHANRVLEQQGETIRIKARKVGAILDKLGFPERARGGDDGPYQLGFDEHVKRHIHRLVKFYGAWQVEVYGSKPRMYCRMCYEHKLLNQNEMQHYENVVRPAEERRQREKEAAKKQELERLRKLPSPPPLFIEEPAAAVPAKPQRSIVK
jgi:hypothetical protein